MSRRRSSRRWEDSARVIRAAMRHDLEELLQAKIHRAYQRVVHATNTGQPPRVRAALGARLAELRAQLARVEKLRA